MSSVPQTKALSGSSMYRRLTSCHHMVDTSVVLLIRKQLKRKSILSSAGSQPLFSLVWVAAGVPAVLPT